MTRAVMWALLAVVASAASVLSFSALQDLALLCGFDRSLAWLLPVVVDAGAAAGCLVWLSRSSLEEDLRPQRFARSLTWLLLASSVVGNALVHGLSACRLQPAWWVVVAVSAIAPAVLGAVVHLAVLVGRPGTGVRGIGPIDLAGKADNADGATAVTEGLGRRRLAAELGVTEYQARRILAERNGVSRRALRLFLGVEAFFDLLALVRRCVRESSLGGYRSALLDLKVIGCRRVV